MTDFQKKKNENEGIQDSKQQCNTYTMYLCRMKIDMISGLSYKSTSLTHAMLPCTCMSINT